MDGWMDGWMDEGVVDCLAKRLAGWLACDSCCAVKSTTETYVDPTPGSGAVNISSAWGLAAMRSAALAVTRRRGGGGGRTGECLQSSQATTTLRGKRYHGPNLYPKHFIP